MVSWSFTPFAGASVARATAVLKRAHTLAARSGWGKCAKRGALIALTATIPALGPAIPPASAQGLSGSEVGLYREAVRAADAGRLEEATALAARGRDPIAAKLVRWIEMTTPRGGTFSEIAAFIRENPQWPAQPTLRRRAETALAQGADQATTLDWFDHYPPVSTDGVETYAAALIGSGRESRAVALVRSHWVGADMGSDDEAGFLARFGRYLRGTEHSARLTRLLWEREAAAVARLIPLLDAGHAALAKARLALYRRTPDALALARAVPGSLARDEGLLYDIVVYHRRADDDASALAALRNAPKELERPEPWWRERHIQARNLLDQGDAEGAYKLVANHRQDDGSEEAEAEFVAGWIALRFLNRPRDGFEHFQRLFNAVSAPISVARGAYWCGRAKDAMGDNSEARDWYAKAARQGTTFYGQLAAAALGRSGADLPREPNPSSSEVSAFEKRELVRAARLLAQIAGSDDDRTAAFVRRVALDANTPEEYALSARLGREIGRPDLAIYAAKRAARVHVYLMDGGYPVLPAARTSSPEPALTHAIIRQESTFNTTVVSGAGARGLMQLMPGTAKLVAKKLGVRHADSRLISDPSYNIQLGSTYLADQVEKFDGSYVMAAAAYNAGPGRVVQWNGRYGDPRTGAVDMVDWIERIPYSETRNYVQRVMEAMIVYRQRLGTGRTDLLAELKR